MSKKDKAVVLGETSEGTLIAVAGDNELRVGIATPQPDGAPIDPTSDLVRFTECEDGSLEVETMYKGTGKTSSKPVTKAYTKGWDRIFGAPKASASSDLN